MYDSDDDCCIILETSSPIISKPAVKSETGSGLSSTIGDGSTSVSAATATTADLASFNSIFKDLKEDDAIQMIDGILTAKLAKHLKRVDSLVSNTQHVTKLLKERREDANELIAKLKIYGTVKETTIEGHGLLDPDTQSIHVKQPVQQVYIIHPYYKTVFRQLALPDDTSEFISTGPKMKSSNKTPIVKDEQLEQPMSKYKTESVNDILSIDLDAEPANCTSQNMSIIEDDIIPISSVENSDPYFNIPPSQPIIRPPLRTGSLVLACTSTSLDIDAHWEPATIQDIRSYDSRKMFEIKFDDSYRPALFLSGHLIAYRETSFHLIKNGTRVVAYRKPEPKSPISQCKIYAGYVAETPRRTNCFRYMIFFDTGQAGYVRWDELFEVVSGNNLKPFSHLPTKSQRFLEKYYAEYPERAMVKFQIGQKIKIFVDGEWLTGKVEEIDYSLVKFFFRQTQKHEWLYRGSTRLYPLSDKAFEDQSGVTKYITKTQRAVKRITQVRRSKRSTPFVEYTREEYDPIETIQEDSSTTPSTASQRLSVTERVSGSRNVVKKSAGLTIRNRITSEVRQVVRGRKPYEYDVQFLDHSLPLFRPKPYRAHRCGPHCLPIKGGGRIERDDFPYNVPIKYGWERQIAHHLRSKQVYYIAPCGLRLRSIDELDQYLYETDCQLSIDLFTYFPDVNLYVQPAPNRLGFPCHAYMEDIANGSEYHSIPVINQKNDEVITDFYYHAERFPTEGVKLILDTDFLPCCNCTDNCRNPSTCQCQRITNEAQSITLNTKNTILGYKNRRLPNEFQGCFGIFECNSRCPCNDQCPNKLVQFGMRVRLQIFRTMKKGWGIQCLHDIPPNTFICTYAAEILGNSEANDIGSERGDEYFADLDYVDYMEAKKEGYESFAPEISSSSENESEELDSDYDDGSKDGVKNAKKSREPQANRKRTRNDKVDDKVLQPSSSSSPLSTSSSEQQPCIPLRKIFGEDFRYTLDAKFYGNIGKYLNHSCEPNCYVQNVFIDTHDLRFPWVAFFSAKYIRAYEEITWDYSYVVGSIKGRRIDCYCGSKNCRGRLL